MTRPGGNDGTRGNDETPGGVTARAPVRAFMWYNRARIIPIEDDALMPTDDERGIIESAIAEIREMSPQGTDGKWLEDLVVRVAPLIREWDIEQAWSWGGWPYREANLPGSTAGDTGIDIVALRRSDRKYIAIQCKARRLDAEGRGNPIDKGESDSFAAMSSGEIWHESWIVSNADVSPSPGARQVAGARGKPIKLFNIRNDLNWQLDAWASYDELCAHCDNPADKDAVQTKTCMQNHAVTASVRILQEHADSDSGGSPVGEARGRVILPCGTGKTRISLRIVEELTPPGEVSVVLCPSIALVAQIRREYLQHAKDPLDVLAVCSDQTAGFDPKGGFDPKKEGSRNATLDPTLDIGNVSESEIKGRVTTDAGEIADWMLQPALDSSSIKVLIGTYQSSVKVSEALLEADVRARVLIADEAHRTAGLKRRNSGSAKASGEEKRVRDFTVCHDQSRFPTTYRVYQTATPRIYDGKRVVRNENWIVRSMDDETTFGVELYRKSYVEAVRNKWLSDYRIIAVGVNGQSAFDTSNFLAQNTQSVGRRRLTTTHYLRGLAFALAMGGATQGSETHDDDVHVDIQSCIAFMNTVDKSKNMARDLQTDDVKKWVADWLAENEDGRSLADYSLEHLDASSDAAKREAAKTRLAAASSDDPRGIINVGIFGEGTDSPSLSAVAFLEARKSPIDVVQAVGRAMRTAPDKKFGYIICPIVIPLSADPESWLKNSDADEGWQELGEILLALRAHDKRIEEELEHLLYLYLPEPPPMERAILAVVDPQTGLIEYSEFEGPVGAPEEGIERMLDGESREDVGANAIEESPAIPYKTDEPTIVVAGKRNDDGSQEIRMDTVHREKPNADGERGAVDIEKTKSKAKDMLNKGSGRKVDPGERKKRSKTDKPPKPCGTDDDVAKESVQRMLQLSGMDEDGSAIKMNLLTKSGLSGDRVTRDLNILEASVSDAARHLREDDLLPALNRHFGLDRLKTTSKAADGCTIAALLMMNAAMLHQRIFAGRWLSRVKDLATIKNDVDVIDRLIVQWSVILGVDFEAVLNPAVEVIFSVRRTGKLSGLERALRHIAAEAERIAETYADMGADHAGPLFNRVMGNQASDGAFFTRPVAAALAARLTLDACGDADWSNSQTWRDHKILDPACGSGTLLAALLADMKRRAKEAGANDYALAALQRLAVEKTIKGLDINPVSLQLAASQLTAGNQSVRYRGMGLYQMPYGPDSDNPAKVSAGTLELLGQKKIVSQRTELDIEDDYIDSRAMCENADFELEDAVDAARNARIVIMNPPFTNRANMGEKFPTETQEKLRERADCMERKLTQADPELVGFADKNSIEPLFVGLADHCVDRTNGILTMVNPTIALTAPSARLKRLALARRYHIHTVLTSHQPRDFNMSQNTNINESVIVMQRHDGPKPPTRFINLDRMPVDEGEVVDFHRNLQNIGAGGGLIANGWGEVILWDSERIELGDWTPAIWRSLTLANAAYQYANHPGLTRMDDMSGVMVHKTGATTAFESADPSTPGSFPILKSKGGDGQTRIQSAPDDHWIPKNRNDEERRSNGGTYPEVDILLQKAGYLLVTFGQDTSTARLTATADDAKYVGGGGWMPVTGLSKIESKAAAVFLNSTAGRLQLMRNAGRKLAFPLYNPAVVKNIRIPDVKDARILQTLAACWERTRDMLVPQFRDGECEVRRLWDEAVADAMGWDAAELGRLRRLLHREPHVRGLGYNQYADAPEG